VEPAAGPGLVFEPAVGVDGFALEGIAEVLPDGRDDEEVATEVLVAGEIAVLVAVEGVAAIVGTTGGVAAAIN
jgi:hypothetical protein